ncbi:cytochrome o ubiquinol oxidase subunit I [Burkholderiales bacterium]|nr:cytochrome o ubiquinol oxidase subunit I [Burkholderiales bacterium]
MFGQLDLSAIPYGNPIIVGALGISAVLTVAVMALITHLRKWNYLWTEWLCSVDHKRIGVMYIVLSLVMLLRGFADAIMMRLQQILAVGDSFGYLPAGHYDQIFTAHGTIMVLFMAMPFLVGLMNIVVPLQIGARDVAFPFLNSVSFWLTAVGAALVMISLGVGEFSQAGWTGYPPLSETKYSPGPGVDYWIWSLQISGVGTLLTGINFLVTIVKLRAPGMTLMKMPVFVWTTLCTCVLIIVSFPALTGTLAMLTLDRYLGMHFFTNEAGGNVMMYPNLLWIWGHPEVYILILPAFGVFSEVTATFARKKLFGYTSMVYATVAITVLSFTVWLHHFFTMGAGPDVNAVFGIATMIIAVPTGLKIFNWLFTIYRGRLQFTTPVLWTLGFMVTFTIGGMAGVLLAVPPADFQLHNGLFLVAHFHNMLISGALFGYFAGYTYWFPKVFGFKLNERLGHAAFWCWEIGFYLAFMPLYLLGFLGMPRRLEHYDNHAWHVYLVIAGCGAVVILVGIILQIVQLVVSIRQRRETRDVTGDPWNGRTLEWSVSSPPPVYNFAHTPVVTGLDAFWSMKHEGGTKPGAGAPAGLIPYEAIHMPRNTGVGVAIGAASLVFGFAMVWHIWWMAIAGCLGVFIALVARSLDDDTAYLISAAEVARTEARRSPIAYETVVTGRGLAPAIPGLANPV